MLASHMPPALWQNRDTPWQCGVKPGVARSAAPFLGLPRRAEIASTTMSTIVDDDCRLRGDSGRLVAAAGDSPPQHRHHCTQDHTHKVVPPQVPVATTSSASVSHLTKRHSTQHSAPLAPGDRVARSGTVAIPTPPPLTPGLLPSQEKNVTERQCRQRF